MFDRRRLLTILDVLLALSLYDLVRPWFYAFGAWLFGVPMPI